MFPTLLRIGNFAVHSYGLAIAVGFLISLYLMRRDARRVGIDPEYISNCAFWVLGLGIAGTRILYIVMFPDQFSWSDPVKWFAIWEGGLVFQGAIPPAIIFCVYYVRRNNIRTWTFADVVSPYVPFGHAFGRMGCFMYGCCYGARTDAFWGIAFPRVPQDLSQEAIGSPAYLSHRIHYGLTADALWSFHVHPTQLYSAFALLCMFGMLYALRKRWHPFIGSTFPLYLLMYGVFRFMVEFLRDDHNPTHFGGVLSDQQIFALLMAVAGAILFAILYRINPYGGPDAPDAPRF